MVVRVGKRFYYLGNRDDSGTKSLSVSCGGGDGNPQQMNSWGKYTGDSKFEQPCGKNIRNGCIRLEMNKCMKKYFFTWPGRGGVHED